MSYDQLTADDMAQIVKEVRGTIPVADDQLRAAQRAEFRDALLAVAATGSVALEAEVAKLPAEVTAILDPKLVEVVPIEDVAVDPLG